MPCGEVILWILRYRRKCKRSAKSDNSEDENSVDIDDADTNAITMSKDYTSPGCHTYIFQTSYLGPLISAPPAPCILLLESLACGKPEQDPPIRESSIPCACAARLQIRKEYAAPCGTGGVHAEAHADQFQRL